ncbi:hypothetical protein CGRA01v4_01724 [Colletotrichum graminicola]|uniref:Uncharacterized protein n=1 Tax=Colletotrichum graminicola (strain M1.001 / M2 / FGSC 10212) TaxID=645133 RepID=E3QW52_COLGM|nr:uncharacterized protein GLRG_10299 [Colletotrichum graminicola M1.001]EFQ35155.1 hypothetical protein GLRG_10299 [Colletotrichum graminicola M1.001]WDK10445.1 hypothetical protein CGRA01v4_01724 [Colletotrichum graminicola]
MESDDQDSRFGSPPMSPKRQPNEDTIGALRDETPLTLPSTEFCSSPVADLETSAGSSPTHGQFTMPASLQDTHEALARSSDFDDTFTPNAVYQLAAQRAKREMDQSRPSVYSSQILEALRNTTGPVRLIPTLPTSAPFTPTTVADTTSASSLSPNHSFIQQTECFTPANAVAASSPHDSVAGNDAIASNYAATHGLKKCTKCKKDRPLSDYEYMSPMGHQVPRSQCAECREKRRVSAAHAKIKKDGIRAQARLQAQHAQQRQQQHHDQQQQQQASGGFHGFASQTNLLHPLGLGTAMLSPAPDCNANTIAQGPSMATLFEHMPMHLSSTAFPYLHYDGLSNLPGPEGPCSVATFSPSTPHSLMGPAFSSLSFGGSIADAQMNRDLEMLELDLLAAANNASSRLPSPSSVLPPDPSAESIPLQEQQQQQTNNCPHGTLVTVQILPVTLTEADIDLLLNQEMERFRSGRENCRWLKKQDEATVKKFWRRREAAIVLGLVTVPPPNLQPRIGFVYSEGSHDILPSGNGEYEDKS